MQTTTAVTPTATGVPRLDQRMRALGQANDARLAGAQVKRDVKAGRITFAKALHDPRAGSVTVLGLLMAQPGWGRQRALRALHQAAWSWGSVPMPIAESRRVGALTARQREVLADTVGGACRAG